MNDCNTNDGSITISFGCGNSVVQPATKYDNVQAIAADSAIRDLLGVPASVEIRVNGVVQCTGPVSAGDRIEFVTVANKKG